MRKLLMATAALLLAGSMGSMTSVAQQPKNPQAPTLTPETGMPSDKGDRTGGAGMSKQGGGGTTGQGAEDQDKQPGGQPRVEPPEGEEPAKPAPTR